MISAVLKELTEAAAAVRLVSIVRRGELEKLDAFPLAVGSRLVLVCNVNPEVLVPDGYVVIRLQDVAEVRVTEWGRSVERALAAESRLPDPARTPAVRLDGWAGALADLHAREIPLSLDCEDDEGAYFVGILTAVHDDSVQMRHVTTEGVWEDEDGTVYLDELTRVNFGSRYVEVFTRLAGDLA
ncbi:MAG TPA: hypothetical protein VHG93_07460 [Longimicrobium sp.]|nr:hypothetical protein [Longimicrobium sp.]